MKIDTWLSCHENWYFAFLSWKWYMAFLSWKLIHGFSVMENDTWLFCPFLAQTWVSVSRPVGGSDDLYDLVSWLFSWGWLVCLILLTEESQEELLDVLSLVFCCISDLLWHQARTSPWFMFSTPLAKQRCKPAIDSSSSKWGQQMLGSAWHKIKIGNWISNYLLNRRSRDNSMNITHCDCTDYMTMKVTALITWYYEWVNSMYITHCDCTDDEHHTMRLHWLVR